MLVDRYQAEDVFARVPQMAERIDPVLKELDQRLPDDAVYRQVRADFGKRYRYTLMHGRHSCPGYLDYPFQNKRFGHGSRAHFSSLQHLIFSKTLVCRTDDPSSQHRPRESTRLIK